MTPMETLHKMSLLTTKVLLTLIMRPWIYLIVKKNSFFYLRKKILI